MTYGGVAASLQKHTGDSTAHTVARGYTRRAYVCAAAVGRKFWPVLFQIDRDSFFQDTWLSRPSPRISHLSTVTSSALELAIAARLYRPAQFVR